MAVNATIVSMTIWMPEIGTRRGPRYVAIAEAIGEAIAEGDLRPGEKLPTHRDLAYRLGVTVGTISRAYAEAERRGYLVGEVGRGTFVRNGEKSEYDPGFAIQTEEETGVIEMGMNFPALCDTDRILAESLAEISRSNHVASLIQYQPDVGMPAHREAGARLITANGLGASADRVVVSCGVQHAMSVLCTTFARPGDLILTESHTYPGIMVVAQQLHLRLQGLPADEEGLSPDSLDEACRHASPRLLYVTPTLQNPTTTVMSESRRRAIAAIARKHDLFILEDDVYGFLVADRPPPVATFAPERTFYMCSASKALAPGLRVGFVLTPEGTTAQVAAGIRMSVWMTAPLMVEITARWITDGTADSLTELHRGEVAARQRMARDILGDVVGRSHPSAYHMWLHLPDPWRADEFASQVRKRDTRIIAAETFAASRVHSPHAVRVCLGGVRRRERLEKGLRAIADTLAENPRFRLSVL